MIRLRENGAMVEVFYEMLNFEMLMESEAYDVSFNFFANFYLFLFLIFIFLFLFYFIFIYFYTF